MAAVLIADQRALPLHTGQRHLIRRVLHAADPDALEPAVEIGGVEDDDRVGVARDVQRGVHIMRRGIAITDYNRLRVFIRHRQGDGSTAVRVRDLNTAETGGQIARTVIPVRQLHGGAALGVGQRQHMPQAVRAGEARIFRDVVLHAAGEGQRARPGGVDGQVAAGVAPAGDGGKGSRQTDFGAGVPGRLAHIKLVVSGLSRKFGVDRTLTVFNRDHAAVQVDVRKEAGVVAALTDLRIVPQNQARLGQVHRVIDLEIAGQGKACLVQRKGFQFPAQGKLIRAVCDRAARGDDGERLLRAAACDPLGQRDVVHRQVAGHRDPVLNVLEHAPHIRISVIVDVQRAARAGRLAAKADDLPRRSVHVGARAVRQVELVCVAVIFQLHGRISALRADTLRRRVDVCVAVIGVHDADARRRRPALDVDGCAGILGRGVERSALKLDRFVREAALHMADRARPRDRQRRAVVAAHNDGVTGLDRTGAERPVGQILRAGIRRVVGGRPVDNRLFSVGHAAVVQQVEVPAGLRESAPDRHFRRLTPAFKVEICIFADHRGVAHVFAIVVAVGRPDRVAADDVGDCAAVLQNNLLIVCKAADDAAVLVGHQTVERQAAARGNRQMAVVAAVDFIVAAEIDILRVRDGHVVEKDQISVTTVRGGKRGVEIRIVEFADLGDRRHPAIGLREDVVLIRSPAGNEILVDLDRHVARRWVPGHA